MTPPDPGRGSRRRQRVRRWWHHNVHTPLRQLRQGTLRRYLADRLVLRFKIRPVRTIEGWLTPAEAVALYRAAAAVPAGGTVVEIGSWKGKSTYCLARGLAAGGQVIAIDPFDASGEPDSEGVYEQRRGDRPLFHQFQQRMVELGVQDRVQAWPGYSRDFVGRLPPIDFLFIDGDHSPEGCEFDFRHFGPHVVPGGLLAFHDYHPDRGDAWGPNFVIHQRVLPGNEFKFVGRVDSLWLARRANSQQ